MRRILQLSNITTNFYSIGMLKEVRPYDPKDECNNIDAEHDQFKPPVYNDPNVSDPSKNFYKRSARTVQLPVLTNLSTNSKQRPYAYGRKTSYLKK
jgi:hypothetical protein